MIGQAMLNPNPDRRDAGRPFGWTRMLLALSFFALGLLWSTAPAARAQENTRLIEEEPYDEIVLSDEYGAKRYKIEEVAWPDGLPPQNPDPNSSFQFRFFDDNEDLYEVSWRDIKEFIPFPRRVFNEAKAFVASGAYSRAYENLIYLQTNYPKFPGIDELHQEFLYRNSVTFLRAGRVTEALALIEELSFVDVNYRPSPADPTAKELVNQIADRLMGEALDSNNYEMARNWIERFAREYGDSGLPSLSARRDQLTKISETLLGEALGHIDQKRYRKGKELLRQAMRAWPDNPEIVRAAKRIDDEFPTVVVAVGSFPAKPDMMSLTSWDARRWGRLSDQRLFEYARLGAEGGDYACTIGKAGISEDGAEFVIDVSPNRAISRGLTGYDVSQMLLSLADPQNELFSPPWARLIERVRVEEVNQVRVRFRKPHPVPAAYLSLSLSASPNAQIPATFIPNPNPAAVLETERSFIPAEGGRTGNRIVELVEHRYDDPREMANALVRGEVDMVDRIHLGDLPRLMNDSQFSVRQYLLPTTHFIAINPRSPHMKQRTFRRGVAYAINAQMILDGIILDGQRAPGARLVSAPFPAGMGATDPIAYAYDDTIAPRPYDPRLSLILFALARKDMETMAKAKEERAEEKKEETPPAQNNSSADGAKDDAKPAPPPPRQKVPLVLAYPQTPQARSVCGAIAAQLDLVGIDCKLRPLPPGETEDPTHDYDLLYVEAAMWEPLADTRRLFTPNGVAPTTSAYIHADLRRLDEARSWQEVATRLQQLHRTIFDEVPLIPLWQTYDFVAVRNHLRNVSQRPIWLYGDILDWQLAAEASSGGAR